MERLPDHWRMKYRIPDAGFGAFLNNATGEVLSLIEIGSVMWLVRHQKIATQQWKHCFYLCLIPHESSMHYLERSRSRDYHVFFRNWSTPGFLDYHQI